MKCPNPIQIRIKGKNVLDGRHLLVPCNQCLSCRINRRDYWASRVLLESHASITAAFWTLTFSEEGLNTLAQKGPRLLVRNFLNAIRQQERRATNQLRVRSFGVLEYGSDLARPHIHLCLYNIVSTWLDATPYKEGIPRPPLISPQWPHGHVDAQTLNLSSARYCSKYVTKFEDQTEETPILFHAQRPKLGLPGLHKYLVELSHGPLRNEELQPNIRLGGKTWALPPALRQEFYSIGKQLGLKLPENNIATRYLDNITARDAGRGKPWQITAKEMTQFNMKEHMYEQEQQRKARRMAQVLDRASRLALQSA